MRRIRYIFEWLTSSGVRATRRLALWDGYSDWERFEESERLRRDLFSARLFTFIALVTLIILLSNII